MPVTPVAPDKFDFARYEAHAAEADARYAGFLRQPEGIAVWQRVRVAEVFGDGCRDMAASLRWQLGGLTKALDYLTDAPNYLEPWYGIGVTAAAFGAEYEWPEGQAPVARPAVPDRARSARAGCPPGRAGEIMRHVLAMIDYFLEETGGRLPLSWSDLQNPLNTATELVDTSGFFQGFVDAPDAVRRILAALTDELIRFTQEQSRRIGDCLVRPGHGFASARSGTGIGLSTDNLVMISPRAYRQFCVGERRPDRRGVRRDGHPLLRRLGPLDRGGEGEPTADHGGRGVHPAHRPELQRRGRVPARVRRHGRRRPGTHGGRPG